MVTYWLFFQLIKKSRDQAVLLQISLRLIDSLISLDRLLSVKVVVKKQKQLTVYHPSMHL